jgi:hypothetical protein
VSLGILQTEGDGAASGWEMEPEPLEAEEGEGLAQARAVD